MFNAMNVGDSNTAMGYQSLYSLDPDTDDHGSNTAVGKQSGYDVSTGTGNVLVGANAGNSGSNDLTTGDNNTYIGNEATGSASGAVNQTVIGALATGQQNNSVTLGNANVTDVFMGQDSGALVACSAISFPGTQVASGGANALDDYEEGNFTVTIKSGDSGAISSEEGEYVKVGKMVHFRIVFDVSTNFSTQFIDGLPFSCTNAGSPSGIVGSFGVMTSSSNDEPIFASVEAGETTIRFSSGSDVTDAHTPNTTNDVYRFSGFYFAS